MIYLQREDGFLGREEKSVLLHATMERLPVTFFSKKDIADIDFSSADLVVGSVEVVEAVLLKEGAFVRPANTYPPCLRQFLGREVFELTVGQASELLKDDNNLFFKPLEKIKAFTGAVFTADEFLLVARTLGDDFPVWGSEIIEFESEFRVYVKAHEILECCQYLGEEDDKPDLELIKKAVGLLKGSDFNQSTYAFDWGITSSGETKLVEVNSSYAIGKYAGISDEHYFEFLKSGWGELIALA